MPIHLRKQAVHFGSDHEAAAAYKAGVAEGRRKAAGAGSLTITPSPLTVRVDETIVATAMDGSQSVQDVEWSCADDSVATFEPGERGTLKITGKKPGRATLTASSDWQTGSAELTVKELEEKPAGDTVQLSRRADVAQARKAILEGVELTEEERQVCKRGNIDPAAYLKTKRADVAKALDAVTPRGPVDLDLQADLAKVKGSAAGLTREELHVCAKLGIAPEDYKTRRAG